MSKEVTGDRSWNKETNAIAPAPRERPRRDLSELAKSVAGGAVVRRMVRDDGSLIVSLISRAPA